MKTPTKNQLASIVRTRTETNSTNYRNRQQDLNSSRTTVKTNKQNVQQTIENNRTKQGIGRDMHTVNWNWQIKRRNIAKSQWWAATSTDTTDAAKRLYSVADLLQLSARNIRNPRVWNTQVVRRWDAILLWTTRSIERHIRQLTKSLIRLQAIGYLASTKRANV